MTEIRYGFGDNWRRYLRGITEEQLSIATSSLQQALGMQSLTGKAFLDIGSGSGIHSTAAYRLGAAKIFSFDYDADSVECTEDMRRREGSPGNWTVTRGSILDGPFLKTVPKSDIVYSWGVLHHTGDMWNAIRLAAECCAGVGSTLLIGIYNEKRPGTDVMKLIKVSYSRSGAMTRQAILWSYWGLTTAVQLLRGRSLMNDIRSRKSERGMNYWRDLEDWVGGYPYECAAPDTVISFLEQRGFVLENKVLGSSIAAVNELRFRKTRV